jgi:Mor family transcriptional regulator
VFRQLASRLGKKIVYIPIGSLSPVKLKKIRVFHILHGRDKREIAKEYVW